MPQTQKRPGFGVFDTRILREMWGMRFQCVKCFKAAFAQMLEPLEEAFQSIVRMYR
jgi:hypothetical protein